MCVRPEDARKKIGARKRKRTGGGGEGSVSAAARESRQRQRPSQQVLARRRIGIVFLVIHVITKPKSFAVAPAALLQPVSRNTSTPLAASGRRWPARRAAP